VLTRALREMKSKNVSSSNEHIPILSNLFSVKQLTPLS